MENFKDLLNQINDYYDKTEKNKQNMFNYIKDFEIKKECKCY